ncbi:hypothetical protein [Nocardia tengchongensis]|uniref:hypothetical protein n=1 Tax=Nocardia tengchongensis TaxID=2055889 RepID=UPI00360BE3A5
MAAAVVAAESSTTADQVVEQVADELLALIPDGFDRLEAAIAMTVTDETAQVIVSDGQRAAQVPLSRRAIELLRKARQLAAASAEGPWWRFLAAVTTTGPARIEFDYGTEPFPEQQLFPPQAYLADLREYPRGRLPVWLAAYIGHGGRQGRTPSAAAQVDTTGGQHAVPEGLPPLPVLWARWAVVSAAFVAVKSPLGPRVTSALGWFEGSTRSGSTLHRLPHGRAVLSGGIWNAPALDAVYNDGAPMPQFYRGAPDWVADPVLSPRAANGLMSFCYWWDGNAWYRGESPDANVVQDAIPGVWNEDAVYDALTQVLGGNASSWLTALIAAAETGSVTRALLSRSFVGADIDLDSSYYQLILAGVAE